MSTYTYTQIYDLDNGNAAVVTAGNRLQVESTLSGSIVVDSITDPVTVTGSVAATQSGTWNIGTVATITNPVAATQSGTWNIGSLTSITNPVAVTGTFWQATQPISGTVTANQGGTWNINNVSGTISLPTGASTAAKQPALGTAGAASSDVLTVQGIASMTALKTDGSAVTQPVSGTVTANQGGTWNITNVSGTVSLPTGAATAAKQPSLGTAGTPSSDVITVQGKSGMTALIIDGSGVTQPVSAVALPLPSGAATSAKQPSLGVVGSPSSDVITVQGKSGMTALVVDGSGSTQPVSGTVTANQGGTWNITNVSGTISLPTGASTAAKQPALGTAGSPSSDVLTVQGKSGMTALDVNIVSGGSGGGSVDITKLGGNAIDLGNGATGTGTQRVTISNDSTGKVAITGDVSVTGNVAATATDSGNPVKIGAVYNSVEPTYLSGKRTDAQATAQGYIKVANDLIKVAGNSVATGAGASSTGTQRVILSNDSALAANQSVDLTKVAGSTTATGTGSSSGGGVQRVVLSNDSALAANQTVDMTKVGGVAVNIGIGASSTGTQRVAVSNDSTINIAASGTLVGLGNGTNGTALRVTLASDSTGQVTTTNTSQTNLLANGTVVAAGNGAVAGGALRVTIASDSTGQVALASGQSINVLANSTSIQAGNGTSANAMRVTISSDSTGQVAISNTVNTNTVTLNGATVSTGNGVSGSGTQRVTLASDSTGQVALATGTNSIGKVSEITNALPSGTNTIGAVNINEKASYMACTGFFTPAASATNMATFFGSSTKTIRILRIEVDYRSTTNNNNTFFLKRYSSAVSGGTSSAATQIEMDTNNSGSAGTATNVNSYTANPSVGALVGILNNISFTCNFDAIVFASQSSTVGPVSKQVLFDHRLTGQPIVLRGTGEGVAVDNNGATVNGTSKAVSVTWYWTEE